ENVFYGFYFIVIFMCGLVILVVPLLAKVLLKGAFYNAWRYVPVLIIATCLNCFSIYFGTLYNAAKKNSMIFFSTLLGAITNVSVCLLLVPRIGIWGACGASVCGYLVIVMIRIVDTRKIIKIPISKRFVLGNFCILALEAVSMAFGTGTMMLIAGSLFALISIMCIYQFHTKIHRLWS
ncbi:MAG: lipopolysaccharide biosynthesis protein, partial [Intestinibacillus sp.]